MRSWPTSKVLAHVCPTADLWSPPESALLSHSMQSSPHRLPKFCLVNRPRQFFYLVMVITAHKGEPHIKDTVVHWLNKQWEHVVLFTYGDQVQKCFLHHISVELLLTRIQHSPLFWGEVHCHILKFYWLLWVHILIRMVNFHWQTDRIHNRLACVS